MRIIKRVIITVIFFLLIIYGGYKFGLYDTEVIDPEVKEEYVPSANPSPMRRLIEDIEAQVKDMEMEDSSEEISEFEESLEWFTVDRIVDGDTIVVSNDNYSGVKVRYIGIDAPESVHSDETKNTEEGKIASEKNEEILSGSNYDVALQFDKELTDEYGRMLAYVYIYDSDADTYVMLQDILLVGGYCRTMTIEPNTRNASHFSELESAAKNAKAGFWGTGFFQ